MVRFQIEHMFGPVLQGAGPETALTCQYRKTRLSMKMAPASGVAPDLSHSFLRPMLPRETGIGAASQRHEVLVRTGGIEPPTSVVSGQRCYR